MAWQAGGGWWGWGGSNQIQDKYGFIIIATTAFGCCIESWMLMHFLERWGLAEIHNPRHCSRMVCGRESVKPPESEPSVTQGNQRERFQTLKCHVLRSSTNLNQVKVQINQSIKSATDKEQPPREKEYSPCSPQHGVGRCWNAE